MSECGIFHNIRVKDGFLNESNVKVLDNTHSLFTIDKIYKTIDCSLEKQMWASKADDPYMIFSLVGREIKLNRFIYSRSSGSCYPTSLKVLGWNAVEWKEIYFNDSITIKDNATESFYVKSNEYFSSFIFKQIKNSCSYTYIEFWKFDIFGVMRTVNKQKITCKTSRRSFKIPIYALVAIISSA